MTSCAPCNGHKTASQDGPISRPAQLSDRADPRGQGLVVLRTETNVLRIQPFVQNHGPGTATVHPRLQLERKLGKSNWAPATEAGPFVLKVGCATKAPKCHRLVAGAELTGPPLDTTGKGQCQCTQCKPLPPGTYRWVWRPCDGQVEHAPPFVVEDWESIVKEDLQHNVR